MLLRHDAVRPWSETEALQLDKLLDRVDLITHEVENAEPTLFFVEWPWTFDAVDTDKATVRVPLGLTVHVWDLVAGCFAEFILDILCTHLVAREENIDLALFSFRILCDLGLIINGLVRLRDHVKTPYVFHRFFLTNDKNVTDRAPRELFNTLTWVHSNKFDVEATSLFILVELVNIDALSFSIDCESLSFVSL